MIAIIGGTSLLESDLFARADVETIETEYGPASAIRAGHVLFIQRHGIPADTPPHRINHRANVRAIADSGCVEIVAVNSTGSLKPRIAPGTLVVPDDYFNLVNPPTFFDQELKFTVPGLDARLRTRLLNAAAKLGHEVVDGGVYFQVQGPVLETPAEVRFIGGIGDVVGMTMAHEAILAKELDLAYASVCMVDNYANGVADTSLSLADIDATRAENLRVVEDLIEEVIATSR